MDFKEKQKKYFQKTEERRFYWQTKNKYIASKEKKLLKKALGVPQLPLLEVGSGEGANLFNLNLKNLSGIDFSSERVEFAKSKNPECSFTVREAQHLPFDNESFNTVFCRDLLHHLSNDDKIKAIEEMWRVLKKSGRLVIVEANKKNPLICFQGAFFPRERGLFNSTPSL